MDLQNIWSDYGKFKYLMLHKIIDFWGWFWTAPRIKSDYNLRFNYITTCNYLNTFF